MNPQQQAALTALVAANALYRQADAHRTELLELCKMLGVPQDKLREALGLE